jgi:hypothetical protein
LRDQETKDPIDLLEEFQKLDIEVAETLKIQNPSTLEPSSASAKHRQSSTPYFESESESEDEKNNLAISGK